MYLIYLCLFGLDAHSPDLESAQLLTADSASEFAISDGNDAIADSSCSLLMKPLLLSQPMPLKMHLSSANNALYLDNYT